MQGVFTVHVIGDSVSEGAGDREVLTLPSNLAINRHRGGWVARLGILLASTFENVIIHNHAIGAQGPRFLYHCTKPLVDPYNVILVENVRPGEDEDLWSLLEYPHAVLVDYGRPDHPRPFDFSRTVSLRDIWHSYRADDVHPNASGHQIIANRTANFLLSSQWPAVRSEPSKKHALCMKADELHPADSSGFSLVHFKNNRKSAWRSMTDGSRLSIVLPAPATRVFVLFYTRLEMSSFDAVIPPWSNVSRSTNVYYHWLPKFRGLPQPFLVGEGTFQAGEVLTIINRCADACDLQVTGLMSS